MKTNIPTEVEQVASVLTSEGHRAYLVGGCVRDLLLGREPKDWDIATDANPEQIKKLFPDSVYENTFGTVGVKTRTTDPRVKIIEVTTFRLEGKYTDKRHPDEIVFADSIEEDLSRRDFTVNAMALHVDPVMGDRASWEIIDPFGGKDDLENKIIKTVGNPRGRFNEDALRLIRAVRFAAELNDSLAGGGPASGWQIDGDTRRAIESEAGLLEMIAKERVRDEFIKIIMSDRAASGVLLLEELDLLRYVIPELREGLGVGQNKHHIYTVFEHNIRALDYSAKQGYSLEVRLASLLHDVGKPKTKQGNGPDSTFYNHEVVGAKMTLGIMDRLRFGKDTTEKVAHLVRHHLFYYNVGEVTEAGVRRFLRRAGPENIDDLIKVREADRIGSGVPKAVPYKLRHLLFMIDKVKHDPISPKMLEVRGEDIMNILSIPPGPKVGQILAVLLDEVLDDPKRNVLQYLERRIVELGKEKDKYLEELSVKAKGKKEEFESGIEDEMKKKHFVK